MNVSFQKKKNIKKTITISNLVYLSLNKHVYVPGNWDFKIALVANAYPSSSDDKFNCNINDYEANCDKISKYSELRLDFCQVNMEFMINWIILV